MNAETSKIKYYQPRFARWIQSAKWDSIAERLSETYMDIHNLLCSSGTVELSNLFSSLAEELDTKPNYVNYLTVVASADTEEELERMGF